MNLQQRAMFRAQAQQDSRQAFLRDVLDRVSRGMTTSRDADWLDRLIAQLEQDVFDLTATIVIVKEVDREQSTRERVFDGAGTAD